MREESFYPAWEYYYVLVVFLLAQDSLYFGNVIGDGGEVSVCMGLSALLCCDVADELCGVVIVKEPFDLGE